MDSNIEKRFIRAYSDYSDKLFRYCFFKFSNREFSVDLFQETFIRVWEYLFKDKEIDNFQSFLYKTAHNLVIDYYRKKKTVSLDEMSERGFEMSTDEEKKNLDMIDGRLAIEMLKKIPDMYRDAIYMQYVEELSIREIAEILGESENTVSVRIHRGLQKIRAKYNGKKI